MRRRTEKFLAKASQGATRSTISETSRDRVSAIRLVPLRRLFVALPFLLESVAIQEEPKRYFH